MRGPALLRQLSPLDVRRDDVKAPRTMMQLVVVVVVYLLQIHPYINIHDRKGHVKFPARQLPRKPISKYPDWQLED